MKNIVTLISNKQQLILLLNLLYIKGYSWSSSLYKSESFDLKNSTTTNWSLKALEKSENTRMYFYFEGDKEVSWYVGEKGPFDLHEYTFIEFDNIVKNINNY